MASAVFARVVRIGTPALHNLDLLKETAMRHRSRILADRIAAVPAAFIFNGFARLLGALMRRDHSISSDNIHRIIVAKLIGMGSILQATPLLRALKRRYPEAQLTFVTMRSNRELVERLSWVDEVLTLDDRSIVAMARTTLTTIATLIWWRADLYFDLEIYSAFASLLALWAVTRNRIGFYRHSTAFKKGIYTHLVFFNTRMPVRLLYLQLGRTAGVPAGEPDEIGPIRIDDVDRAGVRRVLSERGDRRSSEPYIVVNPNASELLLERRWPAHYVIEAVEKLASLGHRVALVGSRDEQPYVEGLYQRLSDNSQARVVNTSGKLRFGELLALLESASCVLTNDTGPMHMAIALRRPTVCLFGPANPEHYGQKSHNIEIFYTPVFCSPCLYEADVPPCNGNNICMQLIKPEPVTEAVLRLFALTSRASGRPAFQEVERPSIANQAANGSPLGVIVRESLRSAKATHE